MAKVDEEELIDPQAFQAAALLQIVKKLTELETVQKSMIEEGIIEPLNPRTVTTAPIVVKHPIWNKPWFGVKITNDGPNSVWVTLNTKHVTEAQEIRENETWGVKFNTAKIEDLYLFTQTGTATVRIRGSR